MKINTKSITNFIIATLVVALILLLYLSDSPKSYINKINEGFSGRLTKIYYLKVDHYVFTTHEKEKDVVYLSHQLEKVIEIGDSIVKFPNDNYCEVIKPNGATIKTTFIYVPESYRRDFRWPEEWRNKPKEWYGE